MRESNSGEGRGGELPCVEYGRHIDTNGRNRKTASDEIFNIESDSGGGSCDLVLKKLARGISGNPIEAERERHRNAVGRRF